MVWERKQQTNLKEKRKIITLFCWSFFSNLLLMFHLIVKPSEAEIKSVPLRAVAVSLSQAELQLWVLLC